MLQKSLTRFAFFIWASCLAGVCVAGDWTQFRGPGGLGSSDETNLPSSWSDEENLMWKIKLPGYGASSPIALGDRIFVTCYSGYKTDQAGTIEDLRLHVLCVKRADGEIVWDKPIKPKLPERESVRDHGYAAATPVTDGKNLFIFFGKTGVLAFDLEGKLLWQTDVGSRTSGWGCGTSPILYEDLVIVNASVESGSLVALDKTSGKEVWRARGMRSSWNTPHLVSVGGKRELVVSVHGKVLGFDPGTGEQLWSCSGIPDYVCPSVVSNDGVVYVIGGRRSMAIAIRAGGRGDVTATHKLWEARAGSNVSSPVVHKGHLYWVSDRNRTAYCLKLANGEVVYAKRFRAQPYASTVAADGKLYVVTRRGGVYVLAAEPEFKQIAHNSFDDNSTFNASPAIAGGRIYIRSDHHLYCIGNRK